jgi:hypothetical protein
MERNSDAANELTLVHPSELAKSVADDVRSIPERLTRRPGSAGALAVVVSESRPFARRGAVD